MNAIAVCLLSLIAFNALADLSQSDRDRLQFDANQPRKGANTAQWPTPKVREERPVEAPVVAQRVAFDPFTFPVEDEVVTNFPGYSPANATFTFEVVGYPVKYASGKTNRVGPFSYGLWRSFDGGTSKVVWVKWVNDTFDKDFWQSVTVMCDGVTNRLIQVGTWSSLNP